MNTSKPIIDFARMVLTTAVLVGLLFYVLNSIQESPPAKEPSTEATLIGGLLTLATIASTGLLALLAGAATWHAASLLSKGFACQWAIYLEAEFNPRKARNAVGPFVVMAVLHAVIMVGIIGAVLMIAVRAMK